MFLMGRATHYQLYGMPMGSEMVVRPPVSNPTSMPVITPPGTSPSDPVQPK